MATEFADSSREYGGNTLVFSSKNNDVALSRNPRVTARVAHVGSSAPPLDFSFLDLTTLEGVHSVVPRTGKPVPISTSTVVESPKLTASPAPHGGRRGSNEGSRKPRPNTTRYITCAVKLANNSLSDISGIVPLLQSLVVKAATHLQWLDLSFNSIESVPDLSELSLSVLNLQVNKISSLSEIVRLASIKTLTKLSLHGNPVADVPHYRPRILAILPGLRSLDFATVTPSDRTAATTFVNFFRDPEKLPSPPKSKARSASPR